MEQRYSFISAEKSNHSVVRVCHVTNVARSGYYTWTRRSPSRRELDNRALTDEIADAFKKPKGRYGVRRIHRVLGGNERAGLNRVHRLMTTAGLRARPRRRFKSTTNSSHGEPVAPNLLKRKFSADAPDRVGVADRTFLRTKKGWLYLATVIDLLSRKVVGWAVSPTNDSRLVLSALELAAGLHRPGLGLVHHSDCGSTYASRAYRRSLQSMAALASMSRIR
jgi:putative transposase